MSKTDTRNGLELSTSYCKIDVRKDQIKRRQVLRSEDFYLDDVALN